MRYISYLLGIFLFISCNKESFDPLLISRESIKGEWFLKKQVVYYYDDETGELSDSSVHYATHSLEINNSDTCIAHDSQTGMIFYHLIGFIPPDTFWIMPCPLYTTCEIINYPRKFKIVKFNANQEMIMTRRKSWEKGIKEKREYIR